MLIVGKGIASGIEIELYSDTFPTSGTIPISYNCVVISAPPNVFPKCLIGKFMTINDLRKHKEPNGFARKTSIFRVCFWTHAPSHKNVHVLVNLDSMTIMIAKNYLKADLLSFNYEPFETVHLESESMAASTNSTIVVDTVMGRVGLRSERKAEDNNTITPKFQKIDLHTDAHKRILTGLFKNKYKYALTDTGIVPIAAYVESLWNTYLMHDIFEAHETLVHNIIKYTSLSARYSPILLDLLYSIRTKTPIKFESSTILRILNIAIASDSIRPMETFGNALLRYMCQVDTVDLKKTKERTVDPRQWMVDPFTLNCLGSWDLVLADVEYRVKEQTRFKTIACVTEPPFGSSLAALEPPIDETVTCPVDGSVYDSKTLEVVTPVTTDLNIVEFTYGENWPAELLRIVPENSNTIHKNAFDHVAMEIDNYTDHEKMSISGIILRSRDGVLDLRKARTYEKHYRVIYLVALVCPACLTYFGDAVFQIKNLALLTKILKVPFNEAYFNIVEKDLESVVSSFGKNNCILLETEKYDSVNTLKTFDLEDVLSCLDTADTILVRSLVNHQKLKRIIEYCFSKRVVYIVDKHMKLIDEKRFASVFEVFGINKKNWEKRYAFHTGCF